MEKLDGCPEIVRGDFNCSVNKLVSLENGPKRVDSSYSCYWNKLKNLMGSPDIISGDFYCQVNLLDSLIGGPSKVFGSFHCNENELRDIEHIPYFIGHQFYCDENPFFEIWEKTELATLKNTKLRHTNIIELFNYYDPIRFEKNEWVCYSERLNAFLKEIGVDTFEGQLKFYKIK